MDGILSGASDEVQDSEHPDDLAESIPKIKGKQQPERKFFIGTLNNPTESEIDQISRIVTESEIVSFIRYGREKAPKTGTPHLQLYIEVCKKKRGGIKKKWQQ